MASARELLKKAALYRRVAGIKTTGAGPTDRILLDMAATLERLVEAADGGALAHAGDKPRRSD
jgi:hypothetical protein